MWNRQFSGNKDEVERQMQEAQDVPAPAKAALTSVLETYAGKQLSVKCSGNMNDKGLNMVLTVNASDTQPAQDTVGGGARTARAEHAARAARTRTTPEQ